MATKLTSKILDAEPPPQKGATTLWDDEIKGFGARVYAPTKRSPEGARSFFLNYRVDGVERRITIGDHPTWSVTAARAKAKELRKLIDGGEDPTAQKRERREAPTIKDLKDRYVTDHLPKKAANDSKGRRNDELRMLDLIGEALGWQTKVADVHAGDAEDMHKRLTEERGPVRANRVLAIASKAFSLSQKPLPGETKPWRDAAAGNPCKGVERNAEEGKERFFSEAEIAALSDALSAQEDRASADCLRFIMMTGCRPGEAMKSSWPLYCLNNCARDASRTIRTYSPARSSARRSRRSGPFGMRCATARQSRFGDQATPRSPRLSTRSRARNSGYRRSRSASKPLKSLASPCQLDSLTRVPTTCGTRSRASVPAVDLPCRSLAGCWATHSRGRRSGMRISPTIRSVRPPTRSAVQSRTRASRARRWYR